MDNQVNIHTNLTSAKLSLHFFVAKIAISLDKEWQNSTQQFATIFVGEGLPLPKKVDTDAYLFAQHNHKLPL